MFKTLYKAALIIIAVASSIVILLASLSLTDAYEITTTKTSYLKAIPQGSLVLSEAKPVTDLKENTLVVLGATTNYAQNGSLIDVTKNPNSYTVRAFTNDDRNEMVSYNTKSVVHEAKIILPILGYFTWFLSQPTYALLFSILTLLAAVFYVKNFHKKPLQFTNEPPKEDQLAILQEILDEDPGVLTRKQKRAARKADRKQRKLNKKEKTIQL
jgi:hypothetical protein